MGFELPEGWSADNTLVMEWFYANGGERMGPVSAYTFETLIRDSVVGPATLVWSAGMESWKPWSEVVPSTAVCAASEGRYWQRDMVPYEGSFISVEHKDAFFQRLREGIQTSITALRYGGFWIRFVAKFIDSIVNWVVCMVANVLLAFAFFGSFLFQPNLNDTESIGLFVGYQVATMLVGIGLGLGYSWFFLSRYSATPGKLALEMKVVRSDGSPLTTGRIIGRYFAEMLSGMILGIGYIMAAFDEEKRTLHDRICDTRVIKAK